MPASYSKGAPSRTEVDLDKRVKVCNYLKYGVEDAQEVVLRSCDVKGHCDTILNYTNGTLQVNPDSEAVACLECIKQKLHVVVTNIMNQSGGYYELDCNGVLKLVINKSFMMVSEGLTTTPGLVANAEWPTTTAGLLSCAEELTAIPGLLSCVVPPTTTAESIFAGLQTTGAGSILAKWPTTTAGLLSCAGLQTTGAGSILVGLQTTGAGSILVGGAAYSTPIIGLVVIGLLLVIVAVLMAAWACKRWNQNRRPEMEEIQDAKSREQLVP